jgi:hypothetical protein
VKREVDIERLLSWAYVELAKAGTTVWSPWDMILRFGQLNARCYDDQFGSSFRLPAWFGDPHPDAKLIARYVDALGSPAAALVTHHAKLECRPEPISGPPRLFPIMDGSKYRVVGKSYGRGSKGRWRYYAEGAYCPLRYEPTVKAIDASRAEYSVWRRGLVTLVDQLRDRLGDHVPTGPSAPATPWLDPPSTARVLYRREA